jgi:diguanylate cyclase (GGDEF)-like protein
MAGERRLAMYTNLNPGTYHFHVRTVTPDSNQAGGETLCTIRIEKPLYLRWYALIGYILLLAVILNVVWRIRRTVGLERKVGELQAAATSLQSVNSRLETLSYQDALTGIANRRYFEYVIMREWDAARIRNDFLTVLMIDIDFFKTFNDTLGHQCGDEALKKVALSIQSSLFRISDVAARYGGEEFVVILPDTNREHALMVSERIMEGVRNCHIKYNSGIAEELTISIGSFTGIPAADLTFEKFVKRADLALYRAKRTGRNRACIYTATDDGL